VHQVVQVALNHDLDRLCSLGTPQCRFILDSAGTGTAPSVAPKIVSVTTISNRETSPGTWTPGGVLFRLCGLDAKGRPYHSEMLVADNPWGEGLYAMEPVFWSGLTVNSLVSGSPNTGPNPSAPSAGADAWPGCPT